MDIVGHIETFLGEISQGWKDWNASNDIQVVCFRDKPRQSVDTFSTLGMSNHILNLPGERKVRQELVLPVSGATSSSTIVSYLLFVSDVAINCHRALLRGQVIRLPKEAMETLGFEAVYCAMPVFLADNFATFDGTNPPTVIVWVLPIHRTEADYIDRYSWDRFEHVLEGHDPDLFSLQRKPII